MSKERAAAEIRTRISNFVGTLVPDEEGTQKTSLTIQKNLVRLWEGRPILKWKPFMGHSLWGDFVDPVDLILSSKPCLPTEEIDWSRWLKRDIRYVQSPDITLARLVMKPVENERRKWLYTLDVSAGREPRLTCKEYEVNGDGVCRPLPTPGYDQEATLHDLATFDLFIPRSYK
jgi:hypothetical protein